MYISHCVLLYSYRIFGVLKLGIKGLKTGWTYLWRSSDLEIPSTQYL